MTEDRAEPIEAAHVDARKTWERPQLAVLNAIEAESLLGLAKGLLAS